MTRMGFAFGLAIVIMAGEELRKSYIVRHLAL